MNKRYQDLFQAIARNGALNAEKAIEVLEANNEKARERNILLDMRDKYNELEDKIVNGNELKFADYIQLYAGAMVSRNLLEKNIASLTKVLQEYDDNLIPKLKSVALEMDKDKWQELIEDYFN